MYLLLNTCTGTSSSSSTCVPTTSPSSSTCVSLQVLVYRDYLPHIVGDEAMSGPLGRYPGYDPNVDPSIANVFATAAYRFAHLTLQPFLSRLDDNYREDVRFPTVPLFKAFSSPWRLVFEGERR